MIKQGVNVKYTFSEYRRMFNLTEEDLKKSILDVGGQASRFNDHIVSYNLTSNNIDALPYPNDAFNLALCLHRFFEYSTSVEELMKKIKELSRVAEEVRIFSLLDHTGAISELLGPVLLILQQKGLGAEVKQVDFEFQKKGNALLRVWRQGCELVS